MDSLRQQLRRANRQAREFEEVAAEREHQVEDLQHKRIELQSTVDALDMVQFPISSRFPLSLLLVYELQHNTCYTRTRTRVHLLVLYDVCVCVCAVCCVQELSHAQNDLRALQRRYQELQRKMAEEESVSAMQLELELGLGPDDSGDESEQSAMISPLKTAAAAGGGGGGVRRASSQASQRRSTSTADEPGATASASASGQPESSA